MINTVVADCDFDPWDDQCRDARRGPRRRAGRGRARHHRRPGGRHRRRDPRAAPRGRRPSPRPGARHHRHRRLGQVEPHRRADPPPAPRPAGQAARRRPRHRPHPQPRWRRPARRPHPHELPRRRPGLLPQPGHARRLPGPDAPRRRPRHRAARPASTSSSSRRPASARATPPIVDYADVSLYVMTPEFGAAASSRRSTCSTSPTSSRSTSSSAAAPRTPCATSAARWCATARPSARAPTTCPSSARRPRRFNDDGVTALYQDLRDLLAEQGAAARARACCRASPRKQSTRIATVVPAVAGALPRRDQRHRPRLPRTTTERYAAAGQPGAAARGRARRARSCAAADEVDSAESAVDAVEALLDEARTDLPHDVAGAARRAGRRSSSPTPATSRS